ncbi:enoyl-CoA hydratase family protein [Streptacidiphilus sp. ASG 303]|uniref:enoyl-CoA hydratase family protein n=1 Tax=Streptacidiphilus sp. ASG 303 TaxID=2896847 RepID=UPI001E41573F|nr:enoyl-CoA hydratase family protein [Streptacidiphilus sp. ASG 303]MCD0483779.1 enoyl-CoA hydratase family protein [Streptacidiphilus sp. ASG 303]
MTDATAAPLVRLAVEGAVATLTLDSPHNRNALSSRLMAELEQGLAEAAKDPAVRAVVLAHTGKVFCAGADLSEATSGDPTAGPRRLVEILRAVVECPKPVVARVDGHARAGGLGLIGACDIAVAGPASTFAFTEVRLGLAPAVISLPLRPRLDPRAASRYYLTGETFDAAEAARIGLVTVAADDTAAALEPVLEALRQASPQGLAESKRLVAADVLRSFDQDGEDRVAQSALLFGSDEAREGMTAFLERRPPAWAR